MLPLAVPISTLGALALLEIHGESVPSSPPGFKNEIGISLVEVVLVVCVLVVLVVLIVVVVRVLVVLVLVVVVVVVVRTIEEKHRKMKKNTQLVMSVIAK